VEGRVVCAFAEIDKAQANNTASRKCFDLKNMG
jgi:hypothetical protein